MALFPKVPDRQEEEIIEEKITALLGFARNPSKGAEDRIADLAKSIYSGVFKWDAPTVRFLPLCVIHNTSESKEMLRMFACLQMSWWGLNRADDAAVLLYRGNCLPVRHIYPVRTAQEYAAISDWSIPSERQADIWNWDNVPEQLLFLSEELTKRGL